MSRPGPVRALGVLVAGALLAGLGGCAWSAVHSKPGTTTTVILTRHGDTDPGSGALNGTGRGRALVAAAGGMGVTAIHSPDLERNLDTVRPLASHLGIEVTRTSGTSVFAAGSIVDEILDKHAGGVVVWVGNASGNLQAVYRRLGGPGMGPVEFGDLPILTVPDEGPVTVVKRRYGP